MDRPHAAVGRSAAQWCSRRGLECIGQRWRGDAKTAWRKEISSGRRRLGKSARPLARGKAPPEHLPRRGDEHGHDIGVTLAHGGDDSARHVADHDAAGFDIELQYAETAAQIIILDPGLTSAAEQDVLGAFAGSIFRRYRLGEDALTAVAVIRELAGATFGVAERARERSSFHDAVGGPRREPEREDMIRDVERHPRRKAIENLLDLVRHCKFFVLAHRFRGKVPTLPRESSSQKHTLLTIVR